jgi:hypothetical protein
MEADDRDDNIPDPGFPGHSTTTTKSSLASPRYSLEAAKASFAASSTLPPHLSPVSTDREVLAFPAVSTVYSSSGQVEPPLPTSSDNFSFNNKTPSSIPPPTDYGSDAAYDSIDDTRSSGSAEKDSAAFNEDSDNDVAWLNQPKSPTNQLFEVLKVQMEQTDFSSSTKHDQYTDSRFIDAPIPLMEFPVTPINREWEHPKTGMSYKLPFVEHEHSGNDPDLLLATDSDDGSHPKKKVPLEPLHDKKFSSFVSNLLSQRTKQENVMFLDELDEDSTPPPASNAYPHGTLVYDFECIATENKNLSAERQEVER